MSKAPFTSKRIYSLLEPAAWEYSIRKVERGLGYFFLTFFFIGLLLASFSLVRAQEVPKPLSFVSVLPEAEIRLRFPEEEHTDYKALRLREMADLWKGTSLEPHTVMLLSMLLVEDGTVTAERRHDCAGSRGCYAIGIQGHHICHRGTPIVSQRAGKPFKKFCYAGAIKDFEKEYPGFSFDWRIQFAEFSLRMTDCIDAGKTVEQCIQAWNSREVGRIQKVKSHNAYVKAAIGVL